MRGIDEETLLAVRKSLAAAGENTDVIDALISLKIRELAPWMTLEEFLTCGYKGHCWVTDIKGRVWARDFSGAYFTNPHMPYPMHAETITHVQPTHKPEPPR